MLKHPQQFIDIKKFYELKTKHLRGPLNEEEVKEYDLLSYKLAGVDLIGTLIWTIEDLLIKNER